MSEIIRCRGGCKNIEIFLSNIINNLSSSAHYSPLTGHRPLQLLAIPLDLRRSSLIIYKTIKLYNTIDILQEKDFLVNFYRLLNKIASKGKIITLKLLDRLTIKI
jgi:hypothetical protein